MKPWGNAGNPSAMAVPVTPGYGGLCHPCPSYGHPWHPWLMAIPGTLRQAPSLLLEFPKWTLPLSNIKSV